MNIETVRRVIQSGQPLEPQRAALRALTEQPLTPDDAAQILAHLAEVEHVHDQAAFQLLVAKLAHAMLSARLASSALWLSAKWLLATEAAAIVASLDADALVAASERALQLDEPSAWLEHIVPRYASIVGVERALERASAALRVDLYLQLASAGHASALIPLALREPAETIRELGEIFTSDPATTLAALDPLSLDRLIAVVQGALYGASALLVGGALVLAGRDAPEVDAAEVGGLCVRACAEALARGDRVAARQLYARFERAPRPVTSKGEELDSYWYDDLPDRLARDPDAERRAALASFEEQPGNITADFEAIVGAEVKHTYVLHDGWIVVDALDQLTWLAPSGITRIGACQPMSAWGTLAEVTEVAEVGPELLAARAGRALILVAKDADAMRIATTDVWDALPRSEPDLRRLAVVSLPRTPRGLRSTAQIDGGVLTIVREPYLEDLRRARELSTHDSVASGLRHLIADEVRAGSRLTVAERSAPELTRFIDDLGCARWPSLPATLRAMGFPESALSVEVRAVSDAEIARLAPPYREDELEQLWRGVGAVTVTLGSRSIRLCTPAEVMPWTARRSTDLEGTHVVVARAGEEPVILLRVDDGTTDDWRRYSIAHRGAWDSCYLLAKAWACTLETPVAARLASLVGKRALQDLHVGDAITLRSPPREVPRREDLAAAWKAFTAWRKENDIDASFQKAASAKTLDKLAKQFPGLPQSFHDSWRRHNGDDESGGLAGWNMMSVDQISSEYKYWTKEFGADAPPPADDPQLPATWWDTEWVPFASSGGGDFLALDTSTAGQGRVVLALMDPPVRRVLAPSFAAWFIDLVFALESGRLEWGELGEWLSRESPLPVD